MDSSKQPPGDDREPAPKPRPRGAGWDDDDEPRRDLGPRPEVPNHGARPFLMGVPILLITVAAIVAIILAGCGSDGAASSGGSNSGSGKGGDEAEAATAALIRDAKLVGGPIPAAAFKDVSCEDAEPAGDYTCTFGSNIAGGTAVPAGSIRIVYSGGELAKRLGGEEASKTSAARSSEEVAALLAADDATRGGPKTTYACATSMAMNPDGSAGTGSASGYLCVVTSEDGKKATGSGESRYVQLRADGAAVRDFVLAGAS